MSSLKILEKVSIELQSSRPIHVQIRPEILTIWDIKVQDIMMEGVFITTKKALICNQAKPLKGGAHHRWRNNFFNLLVLLKIRASSM